MTAQLDTGLPVMTSAPEPAGRPAPAAPRARLAWLDALRGLAALSVAYHHFGSRVFSGFHSAVLSVFDPGLYGVLVFFLISGYIVPVSLERRGSVRSFWAGRLFRLFPLFAVVIAAAVALSAAGVIRAPGSCPVVCLPGGNPAAAALTHLFMLSDLLGGGSVLVVIWTLAYEMVFYLLLTALFTTGQHRRSAVLAGLFAAGALVAGGVLPAAWLSRTAGVLPVAVTGDALVLGGLAVAVFGRGACRAAGAWVAATAGLVLLVLNGHRPGYEGLAIPALMFTGTLLYRAQHAGRAGRRRAALIAAGVFAAVIAAGAWHIPSTAARQEREWVVTVALAGLTFTAGLALREVRVPAVLAWLGRVSYSVYLMLPVLLAVYDATPFGPRGQHPAGQQPFWQQAAASALFAAALLGCAALTYHLVEMPMQRAGRRAAAWLDTRLGPERQPSPQRATPAGEAKVSLPGPARPVSARLNPGQRQRTTAHAAASTTGEPAVVQPTPTASAIGPCASAPAG